MLASPDHEFNIYVNNCIVTIASSNTKYAHWKAADWVSQSFGPGMHQWVIKLYVKKSYIGYLVVGENDFGQLVLIDYGAQLDF